MGEVGESSSRKRKGKEVVKYLDYNPRAKMPNADQKRAFDIATKSPRKVIATKFLHRRTLESMGVLHIVRDLLEKVGLEEHLGIFFPHYSFVDSRVFGYS